MTSYEFDGTKYKKASSHQKEWGQKLISELHFIGTEKILDLGCGDGSLTSQLAELVPDGRVLGVDASLGMIQTAKQIRKSNLEFFLLDINAIDFVEQFDLIFSNATLHWILDHERLLENCYRALCPGGAIRFNFAEEGNCSNFYAVVREAMEMDEYNEYFVDFSWPWYMPPVDTYRRVVEQTRFRETKVWPEKADRYFPDEDSMIRWIDQPAIVPFLRHIAPGKAKKFRDLVVEGMILRTKQSGGTCFETFRRINVLAHKQELR
jgi:trans-aconitate methyltransferase